MSPLGLRSAVLVVVLACGGPARQPAPISHSETSSGGSTIEYAQGSIGVIERTGAGGILELNGDRSSAMAAANSEMARHCGTGRFTITQEGEGVSVDENHPPPPGSPTPTAWRVHYVCVAPN